jgi:threonine dehydratase
MTRNPSSAELAWDLVRSVAPPTPLEHAGRVAGRDVLLKREDLGPTGSFKWRGALCACAALRDAGATAVVTASTGNHGAAVAWAATHLEMTAHVVVPADASPVKCARIETEGAVLHVTGDTLTEAADIARELADRQGVPLLEDGGLPEQLLGTGTIGLELSPAGVDTVVAPMACGALAGGIAQALATASPATAVIGVQVSSFSRLARVLAGLPDPGPAGGPTCADGLADNRLVEPALSACRHLHAAVVVEESHLVDAMGEFRRRWDLVVEGAAAAPLAALRHRGTEIPGDRLALIVSGANIDPDPQSG